MIRFLLLSILLLGCSEGCSSKTTSTESEEGSPIYWTECGYEVGDHVCDFTLQDQNGKYWNLYEHYGNILVLDFSTEWCSYCHVAAASTQEIHDAYSEYGFAYVTIMVEDIAGNSPPTDQALDRWCEHYEISAPVLAGTREMLDAGDGEWPISSWPTFYILNDDLVITHILRGYSEENLVQAIESIVDPS